MKHQFQSLLILFLLSWLGAGTPAHADKMRDLFIAEPGNLFLTITPASRACMVTLHEAGQKGVGESRMGDSCHIEALTNNYIKLHTSPSHTIEMQLLTRGTQDTVIAVIETVKMPTPDSRMSFYSTKWKKLKTGKHFKHMPQLQDFFLPGTAKKTVKQLMTGIAFPLIELKFAGNNRQQVVATQQLKQFYSKDDYAKLKPHLRESITYMIDGTQIKPLK